MNTPDLSYREIPLTRGQVTRVSPRDFDRLSAWQWSATWSKITRSYYVQRWQRVNGKLTVINLHREIFGLSKGDRKVVDHINHDTLDNTRDNLRIVTYGQNAQNRRLSIRNNCGVKGVRFTYGKWQARIRVDGKLISLGRFSSKEEAGQAYNEAAKRFFGEYAVNA